MTNQYTVTSSKPYYTPCNVGIYIGGYKISEAFRVDWDARDSKTPLYGWADDKFTAVSNGRKIVTGRLVINYRHASYLSTAIAEFHDQTQPKNNAQEVTQADFFNEMSALGPADRVLYLAKLAAKNYGDAELAMASEDSIFKTVGADSDETYKHKNTFDILVTYGDILSDLHIETTIKDAYIVGQSQTISASATGGGDVSSSGSPIYEIYSFFAKEIVETERAPRDNSGSPASSVNTF